MKQFKKYLCLALLIATPIILADDFCSTDSDSCSTTNSSCGNGTKTIFNPIIQLGSNLYTQFHKAFYNEDECKWSYDLSATYRFAQTYGCDVASSLFGSNTLWFQGSDIKSPNGSTAMVSSDSLLADYFGMAPDTDVKLNLKPQIRNNIVDLQLAAGGEKLWFQVNLPLMHSKWKLNDCGTTGTAGSTLLQKAGTLTVAAITGNAATPITGSQINIYGDIINNLALDDLINAANFNYSDTGTDASSISFPKITNTIGDNSEVGDEIYLGYMGSLTTPGITLSGTSQAVATGTTITKPEVTALSLNDALNGKSFGDFKGRKYNKFNLPDNCNSEWKLADVQLQLGYDFFKNESHHLGLYLKAVLPTGTEIDADYAAYIFQPIVGNGKHFELGAGMSGHAELWNCDDRFLDINVDAYATHMFKHASFRTFDLEDKPLTRFALLKKLTKNPSANNISTSNAVIPSGSQVGPAAEDDTYPYTGTLVAVGDVANGCYDISAAVRGEAILDLTYSCCDWKVGAGYAFSGKSKEKLCGDSCAATTSAASGNYYGLKGISAVNTIGFQVVIASTKYKTNGGQTYISYNNDIDPTSNMYTYDVTINDKADDSADNLESSLLSTFPSNRSGLMEAQILHRVFGHVDYTWSDSCWMPSFGVVGSVSFSTCSYKTAKNWDIGARLGCSF